MLRSFIIDGSYIAITDSFSSEDRSLPRTGMATTAGAGYRPRGEYAASGFVVTLTKPMRARSGGRLGHLREGYIVRAMAIGYDALHATFASGRVRVATDGGANTARYASLPVSR